MDPGSITVGRTGDLYIIEAAICTVRKIGSDGRLVTVAGSGKCLGAGTSGPAASIAVPGGSAFPVGVIVVSPEGTAASVPGIPYVYASSIADDSKDRLYIVGNVVLRIPPGGTWEPVPGATGVIKRPVGIAIDASDNVYIAEWQEPSSVRPTKTAMPSLFPMPWPR